MHVLMQLRVGEGSAMRVRESHIMCADSLEPSFGSVVDVLFYNTGEQLLETSLPTDSSSVHAGIGLFTLGILDVTDDL
jgi:hypothetical protein